ncbi:MAG: (d)CMP kinase [Thermovirga sp.]
MIGMRKHDSMDGGINPFKKIITIDGPAGAGKSTIAKLLAKRVGYEYLDTGAIYRTISFCLSRMSIPPIENEILIQALKKCRINLSGGKVLLGEENVSDSIRSQEVDRIVSVYSALPVVRTFLMRIQREQAEENDIVADGRDMGSVVFPKATVKIYLDADIDVRAERRWKEIVARGIDVSLDEIIDEVRERDRLDTERTVSPLCVPEGAWIIETSRLSVESVVEKILAIISKNIRGCTSSKGGA